MINIINTHEPIKFTMQWIDIWKEKPPRLKEILFLTGDREIHYGEIFQVENTKLSICKFHCYICCENYKCNTRTIFEERVIYWFPIPDLPQRFKE